MMFRSDVCGFLLALSACSSNAAPLATQMSAPPSTQECTLATSDRRWLDESVSAWNHALKHIAHAQAEQLTAVIFDASCTLTSETALTRGPVQWSAVRHDGFVPLPDGQSMPAQVTSFAAPARKGAFFVMAAPSIWEEGRVEGGALNLETLMTAVLLHEGSHVLQFPTYGEEMAKLSRQHGLPKSFNDDSIQSQFGANQDFAASVARETELLFAAAAAGDLKEVRKLAREARTMMLSRRDRWFRGKDAHLREAEDIWLTMEGSGQWLAYRWLTDPRGGGVSTAIALPAFAKRGKWWSQKQGIALFLVLERLAPAGWGRQVFGGGTNKATLMLDLALTAEG